MEKRVLGKTGENLSVVGFGGIVVMNESVDSAKKVVARAIERGINYFDVAPSYGDAEEKLGPALKPYRDQVFLACKTMERTKEGVWRELKESLKRLRTDHLDLYQFHAVTTLNEVEAIFSPNGAIEAFLEAREEGLIKYIGFSAHSEEAALAMLERFDFDTVLFPLNWASWLGKGFGKKLYSKAREKNMGILAIKALAKRRLEEGEEKRWKKCWYYPVDDFEEASMALRFTLSLPVTAAVSPSHQEFLWWMCDIVEKQGTKISEEELQILKEKAQNLTPVFPLDQS
ncbi:MULTISPECIES: aldo/keto reductase [unclassified Thermotoga]|uniref:aldo/keto reductase n=1 Tax=unclassified Thermotoga TaxID=2631113 RepID=UPI000280E780|nr:MULTISPECIES: aldo/keto reductase [unclassified Thermotoga]AIY87022.1 aldo/keto reductase [Thermotoga sp. 2812B]EJX25739.1 aldo/keto reductase [Thermotoga sp. EMP]